MPPPQSVGQAARRQHVVRLLMDMEEKSKVAEWPSGTSVHCYWCCHKFDGAPYGLPVKYAHGSFLTTGCFCSLECAAAWNFSSRETPDEIHERYALVNMLSTHLGGHSHGQRVRPAPDRACLAMFGGHLTIQEFRANAIGNRAILMNPPPMVSMVQQVEELNESELRSEYKFIPMDVDRVSKYQEKIRLRRTKPLVNFKNTLDCTMNLKYH